MNALLLFEFDAPEHRALRETPRNLTVILDVSSSMPLCSNASLEAVLRATQGLGPRDRLVVIAFAGEATVLTEDRNLLKEQLQQPGPPFDLGDERLGSGTDLLCGISSATLHSNVSARPGAGLYILITDGNTDREEEALEACRNAALPISALGIGDHCNRQFLETISTDTNGRFYLVAEADGLLRVLTEEVNGFLSTMTPGCHLNLKLGEGIKVNSAYLLTPRKRIFSNPDLTDQSLRIPIGDLRKGERASVAVQVTLPSRRSGTLRAASASLEYEPPGSGGKTETAAQEVIVHYSDFQARPQPNKKMRNVLPEIQDLIASSRESHNPTTRQALRKSRRKSGIPGVGGR